MSLYGIINCTTHSPHFDKVVWEKTPNYNCYNYRCSVHVCKKRHSTSSMEEVPLKKSHFVLMLMVILEPPEKWIVGVATIKFSLLWTVGVATIEFSLQGHFSGSSGASVVLGSGSFSSAAFVAGWVPGLVPFSTSEVINLLELAWGPFVCPYTISARVSSSTHDELLINLCIEESGSQGHP